MLGLLAGLTISVSVHSAHARPDDPPAPSKESAVDPAVRDRSRAAFRKGVAQLRAQDWAGARASFEEAWTLVQHPSILLNLGIARLRTDEPVLAEQDLVRFLSEDPGAAADEIASAREALAEARAKIGTLRVVASPASARVTVDDKPVAVRGTSGTQGGVAEVRLKAGKHAVTVEADGFSAEQKSVDVLGKSDIEVRVVLVAKDAIGPKPDPREGPSTRTIVGWSLAGLSGVALAASGVMALRAMSLSSDYEDPQSSSFQKSDVKDSGIGFRTGADVALVTAVLAGAGAVVLLFTDLGAGGGADVARAASPRSRTHPALLRW